MSEIEFVEVSETDQLDSDPLGPSDANALEGGDDLDMIEAATTADLDGEVIAEDLG